MKFYKEKNVPRRFLTKMTCDMCGKQTKNDDWANSPKMNVNETKIQWRWGSQYQDTGGAGAEINIDLCPDCFKTKLIPALVSLGVSIKEEQWDW